MTSLTHLPEAPHERIAAFLLGVELFALSHVNSDALRTFSQERLWTSRCLPDTTSLQDTHRISNSKQRYIQQCQSFSFSGRSQGSEPRTQLKLAFVPVCSNMRDAFGSWGQPFSFETWFSLSSDGGGVLLGAQSITLRHDDEAPPPAEGEPSTYAQLVHIDAERNLFCSVVESTSHGKKSPVARALELHRWYHLVLVYENNQQGESVYLNGELVGTTHGALPSKWRSLYAAQLGTGYVATDSPGTSSPMVASWCDFHGIVHSFQVFRFALSAAVIERLAAVAAGQLGEENDGGCELDEPTFCLNRDFFSNSKVQRVRCSRPQERWCHVMPGLDVEESLESLLCMV